MFKCFFLIDINLGFDITYHAFVWVLEANGFRLDFYTSRLLAEDIFLGRDLHTKYPRGFKGKVNGWKSMAETAADMFFVAKFFDLLALHGVLGRRTIFTTSTSNASDFRRWSFKWSVCVFAISSVCLLQPSARSELDQDMWSGVFNSCEECWNSWIGNPGRYHVIQLDALWANSFGFQTLRSENHSCSFQLFGYDFMVRES